jgi:hypothetical protein
MSKSGSFDVRTILKHITTCNKHQITIYNHVMFVRL